MTARSPIILLAMGLIAAAPETVEPGIEAFVRNWEAASRQVQAAPAKQRRVTCRAMLDQSMDFDALARNGFADLWDKLGAAGQKSLVASIARKAAADCAEHAGGGDISFSLLGVRGADDGSQLAAAEVKSGTRTLRLTWTLRREAEAWKAVDVTVDGRSMASELRARFDRLRHNTNLAAAVERLGR